MKRRFLVPEVIQSSAMDCGPAVLKAALEGYGVPVHLGHLREACQTGVDGTSINTLEDLARSLGMQPHQTLLPFEHLALPECLPLPAVVVLAQADRSTHFVLIWRSWGPWVQIMDPSAGRRWLRWRDLLPQLYRHHMAVGAETWAQWSMSMGFAGGLGRRLSLILGEAAAERLFEAWAGDLIRLEQGLRALESLLRSGAVSKGAQAQALLEQLLLRVGQDPSLAPDPVAVPLEGGGFRLSGAVVMSLGAPSLGSQAPQRSEDLRQALAAPPVRPLRALLGPLATPGWAAIAAAVALAGAAGGVVQAGLLRALLDAQRWLQTPAQRLGAVAAMLLLTALTLGLGVLWSAALSRLGRSLELGLRIALHQKLPRLGDRYFASRLISDLAERAHAVSGLRAVPAMLAGVFAALAALGASLAGVSWLDPGLAPLALASGLMAVLLPGLLHPFLASRELRRQTYDGALARSTLDAMLGALPLRAHGAEESLRREHEALLVSWARAAEDALGASVLAGAAQAASGLFFAAWMVHSHLARAEHAGAALLLVFWAVSIPQQGQALAAALRGLPSLQSVAARVMEPLDAPEEGPRTTPPTPDAWRGGPLGLELQDLSVVAGGRALLRVPSLRVAPGEHLAIVGRSGAGKSSLLSLVLGWWRPSAGELRINGVPLQTQDLPQLRRRVAWVDPAVQLWNRSLLDNLRYGQERAPLDLDAVMEQAELLDLLAELPEGLSSPLGEGGGLLSGGQGQRVRLGRALARPDVGLALLDEPFRGLDRTQRRALLERARRWWAGATLLFVSHDVGDTVVFPRVLVIDDGAVVEDGPPAQLLAQGGLYAALVREETRLRASWGGAGWRRWRVQGGTVQEEGP